MDIQTRKLEIIEYLITLKDEEVFNQIEVIIDTLKKNPNFPINPLTQQEIIDRAKKSNDDYFAGKFQEQSELEGKSKNW